MNKQLFPARNTDAGSSRALVFRSEEGLPLDCGQVFTPFDIAFQTYGTLNAERSNAILICHALAGDQHIASRHPVIRHPVKCFAVAAASLRAQRRNLWLSYGYCLWIATAAAPSRDDGPNGSTGCRITGKSGWRETVAGCGKPVNTDKYFVICAIIPGGCMGASGPASNDPSTGKHYGLNFPVFTTGDMVRAQARLIGHLCIRDLFCVASGSMGGMQVREWSVSFVKIESDNGHDAFLPNEPELFNTVRGFLDAAAGRRGLARADEGAK